MTGGRTAEITEVHEYVFGDYRINLTAFQLWRGGQPITLTPKAFDTLAALIRHRDRAVSKEELLKSVWPDSSVTEDSLTQSISVLRRALGDDTTHPTMIATVARRGYRFIAPVTEVPVEHPLAGESKTAAAVSPTASPSLEALSLAQTHFPPADSELKSWKPWLGGVLLGVGTTLAVGAAVLAQVYSSHRGVRAEVPPLRFSVSAPSGTARVSGGVLSPDGRYLLLLAENDRSGFGEIWIRSLAGGQSQPFPVRRGHPGPSGRPTADR